MKTEEIETLMRAVSSVVKDLKEQHDKALAALVDRIEAAEKHVAEPGRDGRDADHQTIRGIVRDEIESLPKPQDGRDALEIDVEHGINPRRSYKRGTFAAYRGGIIRAFRATDPILSHTEVEKSGWQVVLNGIDEDEETQRDGGRVIERITTYTNGTRVVRTSKRMVPIYRGVYKSGSSSESGDVVTYGGSLWICNASSPTKIPPGNDGSTWTLCVKRGRDARHDRLNGEAA